MISFNKETKTFHLKTKNTSYIFRLRGDYILEHMYWGASIDDTEGMESTAAWAAFAAIDAEYKETDGTRELKTSTEMICQEYPTFGSTDMRKPAFHAAYDDGSRITKMKYLSHKIFQGKPKLPCLPAVYCESDAEADTLEITLEDELTGLVLLYRYSVMNDFDAITRNVEVINSGEKNINIKAVMSCNIDFPCGGFEFINLSGAWARERHIERRTLGTGTTKVESRRGASSHHQSPFFALSDNGVDEERGNVYGFSFVYSGNFEAGVEVDTFGRTRAFMGINSFDFNWKLESGERFVSPEAVLVYSDSGLGGMSRIFHSLYKKRLARGEWRDKERPILVNNWEGTYFNFDEEKIASIAECAKKAGIEMLVLDDGWFGERNTSKSSLGDWYVNKCKLPNGISGLADRINKLGLKFGLWFEPEMVSPDSNLYREHPEWCLHVKGRGKSECRSQLILDLSRADVRDFIIEAVSKQLSSANIEYVKWDMNRNMTEVGSLMLPPDRQAEAYHRYILGLYEILEVLTSRFPHVLFEGCSGGGGRFDAGSMYYFNQYWTSDNSDAIERMYIQYGTSLVMPAAFMSAHVSAVPNHQVGRITSLNTRGLVAMQGQFGYELDMTKLTQDEISDVSSQIEVYKSVRKLVHEGEMYRIVSPFEKNSMCIQYLSEDKSRFAVFYHTIMTTPEPMKKLLKLRGLNLSCKYRLLGTDNIYSSDLLMNYGIVFIANGDAQSNLLIFERV